MALSSTQIKKALKDRKLSMASVAREAGVSSVTVWRNVHKVRGATSARVQEVIAQSIGKERDEVFGNAA